MDFYYLPIKYYVLQWGHNYTVLKKLRVKCKENNEAKYIRWQNCESNPFFVEERALSISIRLILDMQITNKEREVLEVYPVSNIMDAAWE